jgi:uncharacterized protein
MSTTVLSLPFTRVLTSPGGPTPQDQPPLRRAILAGLLDAGVRGVPVASLWFRPAPWAPLQILIAGALSPVPAGAPSVDDCPPLPVDESAGGNPPLLFPLGATGTPVAGEEVEKLLAPFSCWTRCAGGFEPLLRDSEEQATRAEERWSASPLDDVAGYLSHQAFAWLVVCTPVPEAEVRSDLEMLRRRLFRLHQSGGLSETETLELERDQAWFRELSRAGAGGVWDVAIAAGTANKAIGIPVASILCTAAERSVSLYRLRPSPGPPAASATDAVQPGGDNDGMPDGQIPFRATADLAAALVRPPEAELPGIRVVAPPTFDTTLEPDSKPGGRVKLGTVLDRFLRPAGDLTLSTSKLGYHTFVCGATGGGKSQTVRALLEELSRGSPPVPWLVIEPAKAEYARMAGRLADIADLDVLVIAPGHRGAPPASMNPLEPASLEPGNPARTYPLQSHADLVRGLFLAAFQADEPFPQVLSRALTQCYEASGWDLVTSEPLHSWDRLTGQALSSSTDPGHPRFPALSDLQLAARRVVDEIGYADDIKKNVRGFVDIRLGSLRHGTPGRFFEGGHPLDFAALLQRNVVLEIEGITNDQDKAFVMGAVLIRIYEQLLLEEKERFAATRSPSPFRHLTVIEEAHRLLRNVPRDSPAAHSLELFASLLAEVRAYGAGIVIAEQIPAKLIPDVIKNTALKIVHRLPAADDREAVGATMNLSEAQSEYVVTLDPGVAAVFADGMDHPVLAKMPNGETREDDSSASRAAPLVAGRRRSRSCGEECRHGQPCSLTQMRRAEHFLDAHPELTLWMEISFAAHGMGDPAPTLQRLPAVAEARATMNSDPRLVQCAVAHAVEAALATRYDHLAAFFDPEALGNHLGKALTQLLLDEPWASCDNDRGRWRFGNQRFGDIRVGLGRLSRNEESVLSYDALVGRARERGVELSAGTPAADLGTLGSHPANLIGSVEMRLTLFGDRVPALVISASARLTGPGEPIDQVTRACRNALRWAQPKTQQQLMRQLFPTPAGALTEEAAP